MYNTVKLVPQLSLTRITAILRICLKNCGQQLMIPTHNLVYQASDVLAPGPAAVFLTKQEGIIFLTKVGKE